MTDFTSALQRSFEKRSDFFQRSRRESTNAYRLFHGTVEGVPGLSIDRYGRQILIQTFHNTLASGNLADIESLYSNWIGSELLFVYNDRRSRNSRYSNTLSKEIQRRAETPDICQEMGTTYRIIGRHQGQDPLLFLDARAVRRVVSKISEGQSVLNLFAYTCGVGIRAALSGAKEVLNIDFSSFGLEIGQQNAKLNHLSSDQIGFLNSDFFPAVRQLAGLPVKSRRLGRRGKNGARRPAYPRLSSKHYDLVVLDPPRWAKSSFGTVDLIRDYQSVLKPALLATTPGGRILATNNVAKVPLAEWLEVVRRCGKKCGRPIRNIEIIQPEEDFPSFDRQYPLKILLARV